jgi:NADPH:quinone reductase-like Zn-dependent oxidoreductase
MEHATRTKPQTHHAAQTELPRAMRAIAVDRLGGVDGLVLHDLPLPRVGSGEVLIELHAAGVGSWDIDMRENGRDGEQRFPFVPGVDGAGTVAAVGTRVKRFEIGERVYAYDYARTGFYAEYVAVPADHVAPVPAELDFLQAGGLPAIGLTALQGIDDALHLRAHESVIVLGASGGVGSIALQFAKLCGARVLAAASGDDGCALARRLGADAAVDARRDDLLAAARAFAPGDIDAVLALAGGAALDQCLEAVRRPGGRLAYPNGVEPEPKRQRDLHVIAYDGLAGQRQFERLAQAVEAASLEVPIAASYPLTDARKAHERVAAGHVLGKVVLRIRD